LPGKTRLRNDLLFVGCRATFTLQEVAGGSLKCGLIRIAPTSRRLKKLRPINLCRLPTLITILAKHIVINISKITLLIQYNTASIVTTVQCKFQQIKSISIMPCASPIPLNSAVFWVYPSLLKHVAPLQGMTSHTRGDSILQWLDQQSK